MNVRRKNLEIGYKFSHWTKDILPRVLTTPIHLIRLFTAAREELDARASAKNPSKKPLQVTIIDLRPKLPEKGEPKKVTKKPKSKVSFWWVLGYLYAKYIVTRRPRRPIPIPMMMRRFERAKKQGRNTCVSSRQFTNARNTPGFALLRKMVSIFHCPALILAYGVCSAYVSANYSL
jgi:hypothetical protein